MKSSYKTLHEVYKKDLDAASNNIAKIQSEIHQCKHAYDEIQNKIGDCYSYKEIIDIGLVENTNRYILKLREEAAVLSNSINELTNDLDAAKSSMLDIMKDIKKLNILIDKEIQLEKYEEAKIEQKETDEFNTRNFWGRPRM